MNTWIISGTLNCHPKPLHIFIRYLWKELKAHIYILLIAYTHAVIQCLHIIYSLPATRNLIWHRVMKSLFTWCHIFQYCLDTYIAMSVGTIYNKSIKTGKPLPEWMVRTYKLYRMNYDMGTAASVSCVGKKFGNGVACAK